MSTSSLAWIEYLHFGPKIWGKTISYLFLAQLVLQACNEVRREQKSRPRAGEVDRRQRSARLQEIDVHFQDVYLEEGSMLCPESNSAHQGMQKLAQQELERKGEDLLFINLPD